MKSLIHYAEIIKYNGPSSQNPSSIHHESLSYPPSSLNLPQTHPSIGTIANQTISMYVHPPRPSSILFPWALPYLAFSFKRFDPHSTRVYDHDLRAQTIVITLRVSVVVIVVVEVECRVQGFGVAVEFCCCWDGGSDGLVAR